MNFLANTNVLYLMPEIFILAFILMSILKLAFSKDQDSRREIWDWAVVGTLMSLLAIGAMWYVQYFHSGSFISHDVFSNAMYPASAAVNHTVMFTADLFSLIVRTLLLLGTLLVLMFSKQYVDTRSEVPGEFYIILLSALFGGMLLSGSSDLIMVFVALETLSISSYVLAGYLRGDKRSGEAGLKYLLYGGMSTALLLFGFSILYGLTGTTSFAGMAAVMGFPSPASPLVLAIMTVTILAGICFKLSAAPFHMWAPDVYEGAPTPVVAFLSVVSKIAGFSLAIRLFSEVLGPMNGWVGIMTVLSVLSMLIGNIVALTQRDIKRLMAYSTVAHVGYLFLGFVVLSPASLGSMLYYLVTYLFMNLGAFAVITQIENKTGRTDIAAYAGLVRKHPWMTTVLSVMLLSLAGIPITGGFFAKFFLFGSVAAAGTGNLWLVVIALLTSTISLYYYLNVIRVMVIAEPAAADGTLVLTTTPNSLMMTGIKPASNFPMHFAMAVCLIVTVALGIFSDKALTMSQEAMASMSHTGAFAKAHAPIAQPAREAAMATPQAVLPHQ